MMNCVDMRSSEECCTLAFSSRHGMSTRVGYKRIGRLYIEWTIWNSTIELKVFWDGLFKRSKFEFEVELSSGRLKGSGDE